MSHLTDFELIAAVEDAAAPDLPPGRRRHLDACDACRRRADELRLVMVEASEATVPEPSPLFWQHFSARVQAGIDGSEPGDIAGERGRLAAWFAQGSVRWALFASLVVTVMIAGVWQVSAPRETTLDAPRATPQAMTELPERADVEADPAWAVVRTVADSVEWSDSSISDIGVQPDAVESVARTLTPEERSELVRLLLAEAKRNGA